MAGVEICSNCGEKIGSLEPAMLWRNNIVCLPCHRKLKSTEAERLSPLPPAREELSVGDIVPGSADPLDQLADAASSRTRPRVQMYAPTYINPPQRVQLIEQTSKEWKAIILAGVLMLLAGAFVACIGIQVGPPIFWGGVALMFAGGCIGLYGRIGAWWNHG